MVTRTRSWLGHRAKLFFVFFVSVQFTLAHKPCKNKFMDIIITQCINQGMRSQRHARDLATTINPLDAETMRHAGRTIVKRQLAPDPDSLNYHLVHAEAGQLTSGRLSQRTEPLPTIIRRNRAAQYSMGVAGPIYYDARFYPWSILAGSRLPQPDIRFGGGTLPDESSDDLGFDLTDEEMDDFYNELLERFPRNSLENSTEVKKVLHEEAAKCCKNEETCGKKKPILKCI